MLISVTFLFDNVNAWPVTTGGGFTGGGFTGGVTTAVGGVTGVCPIGGACAIGGGGGAWGAAL